MNHPRDRGGHTMRGVTLRTYNDYAKRNDLPFAHGADLKDKVSPEIARAIAREYYDGSVAKEMESKGYPLAGIVLADIAFNAGPGNASKALRQLGDYSGLTDREIALKLSQAELARKRTLGNWDAFGRGWTNRHKSLEELIRGL